MAEAPTRSSRSRARLLAYMKAQRRHFAVGILMLGLTNLCVSGIPYLTKRVFDALEALARDPVAGASEPSVAWFAGGIVVLAVAMAVFRVFSRIYIFDGGREMEFALRNDLYAHLLTLGPSFFGRMAVGDLVSRVTNDITAVRLLGGPGILNLANTAIVYVSAIVPMALISPMLTAWALAPLVLIFVITRRVGPAIYQRSYRSQEELARLSSVANESIAGISVVQAYAREDARRATFRQVSDSYRKAWLAFAMYRSVMLPILAGMGGIGTLTILWFGGRAVILGELSLGDFVGFMGYLAILMWPTVALGWMLALWQRGLSAMDRLAEILEEIPEVTPDRAWRVQAEAGALAGQSGAGAGGAGLAGGATPGQPGGAAIEIRGLRYAWSGAAAASPARSAGGREALRGVDLRIEPGEHVLLVGPSGAGKSTLLSFIPRLCEAPPGSVFVGGREVRDWALPDLRRAVAFVPQVAFLFGMSVRENIGFGVDGGGGAEAVAAAADLAAIDAEIAGFPDAYETIVGERGITLSGGQRQRMTIARAAAMRPSIWVFDDCLSSVDAATEQAILRNLRRMTREATALFVTHRLIGFEGVDRVVVLDGGRVVEQGTHAELLARGGWYARLYRKQKLDEELEGGEAALAAGGAA
jgi:ATP-binding cassette subfamily B protein